MRILAISKLYAPVTEGGYELQFQALIDALAETHVVRVLTTDLGAESVVPSTTISRSLPYARYVSKLDGRRSISQTITAVNRVRSTISRFAPDLVYIGQGSGMPHAVTAAVLQTRVPVALSIQDYWPADLYRIDPFMKALAAPKLVQARIVAAINRATVNLSITRDRPVAAVWVSDYLRANLELPGCIRVERETVVRMKTPTAAAFEDLYSDHRAPISQDAPTLLFTGRAIRDKGIHLLIEAAAQLRTRFPGITVRVAGKCEPEMAIELSELADRSGLGVARITILGRLAPAMLARELELADVFVMPSVWAEPGAFALQDAASAGVPVVASSAGGMPEALHPDAHGTFFPPGDCDGLVAAIADTIVNVEQTERRRRAARLFYQSETTRHGDEMVEFVEQYVGSERIRRESLISSVSGMVPTPFA